MRTREVRFLTIGVVLYAFVGDDQFVAELRLVAWVIVVAGVGAASCDDAAALAGLPSPASAA